MTEKLKLSSFLLSLDANSIQRVNLATGRIKDMLKILKGIEDVFETDHNWWEWISRRYWKTHDPIPFTTFHILYENVKSRGIKRPIIIEKKEGGICLRNGCHRTAIAKLLEYEEIEVEYYNSKD